MGKRVWAGDKLWVLLNLPPSVVRVIYPEYSRDTIKGKRAYWNKQIKEGKVQAPPRPKGFDMEELTPEQEQQDATVRELLEYLQDKGVPISPEDHQLVRGLKIWEMGYKDAQGDGQSMLLHSVEMGVDHEALQADIIRQAPPVEIRPARATRTKSRDKVGVIVPDLQGGFRRHGEELEPIHDEKVVSVGLQIIRDLDPDLIVLNGDNLDFPDLSRFPDDSHHFQQVMQATVDRVYMILAEMRASAPDAKIVWLAGNHEDRLNQRILKHNLPLWGVKRPGSKEDFNWLSVPHLMNLSEIDVDYIGGYPANSYLINNRLQAIHGKTVRSKNSTAALYTKEEDMSTIFGHVHRIERHTKTSRRLGRTIVAASFGTWARIDGAVPSYHSGVNDDGEVVRNFEDWQNGMGVVEYQDGDSPFNLIEIPIDHNDEYEVHFNGKRFRPHG